MDIALDSSPITLPRGVLLRIRDGQGTRIACHDGALWITQEYVLEDHVVKSGESFVIERPGLTLVTALEPSLVAVAEPSHSAGERLRRWLCGWLIPTRLCSAASSS